ncbi:MAG: hypothetical protein GTN70_10440 [Deltaproteobacteria bacterium]|nr:hypothetical protein [Deltaproteobacteria bacterium]NIS78108.1 hypothetical protein [Deltaproteobacteria bacterium]
MNESMEMLIYEMALRVRLFRMMSGSENDMGHLSDREMLILELLGMRKNMSVSEIAALCPTVSGSTISTTITKLWKDDKLVNKTILPENQRVTTVSLTDEGKRVVEEIRRAKSSLYGTIAESLGLSAEEEEIFKKILANALVFFDEKLKHRR